MTSRRTALVRACVCGALAALLGGCVPIGVRVQNMFSALIG
jgi:hypothetical protein